MHMITEDEPSYHARALYRRLSARPWRVLYVGLDVALLDYLKARLEECWIVRAPAGCVARPFIEHLRYSVLVFDEVLMDMTAREVAGWTRELAGREGRAVVVFRKWDEFEMVAGSIEGLVAAGRGERRAALM
ncbi:MAG: hypothetical protein QOF02_3817 [Blastocatellia bacterium]|jgi:hypothetical protein|nr:hypothetical protein [Blastocatellia bacterium]